METVSQRQGYNVERSLWAEPMPFMDHHKQLYAGKDALITAVETFAKAQNKPWDQDKNWDDNIRPNLGREDLPDLKEELGEVFGAGHLTDPRVLSQARHPIEQILDSPAGRAARIASVKELKTRWFQVRSAAPGSMN